MEPILLLIAMAALTVIVLVFVFMPLARGQVARVASREAFARAVYREQLQELTRDRERGVIDAGQVEAARREIERRLLAADQPAQSSQLRPRPILAAALAIVVLLIAAGVYTITGRPQLPDLPYAARRVKQVTAAAPQMPRSVDTSVSDLEAKLKTDPNDVNGWVLLARIEAASRDWEQSAQAMRHAKDLAKNRSDIAVAYGEVQVQADGGFVLPSAREAFLVALAKEPMNPSALWYLGLEAMQHRHADAARGYWKRLLKQLPDGSSEHKSVAAALVALDKAVNPATKPDPHSPGVLR